MNKYVKNSRRYKRKKEPIYGVLLVLSIIICLVLIVRFVAIKNANIKHAKKNINNGSDVSSVIEDDSSDLSSFVKNKDDSSNHEIMTDITENSIEDSNSIAGNEFGDDYQTYFNNDVCILGDSITEGLIDYNYLSKKNVVASRGANVNSILTKKYDAKGYGSVNLVNTTINNNPKAVYIILGVNSLVGENPRISYLVSSYGKIVDKLQKSLPNSKIYVVSVPPVAAKKENASKYPVKNSNIDDYNSGLKQMASEFGVKYVDLNSSLKDANGKFKSDLAEGDGVHFKAHTYPKMLQFLYENR